MQHTFGIGTWPVVIHARETATFDCSSDAAGFITVPGESVYQAITAGLTYNFGGYTQRRTVELHLTNGSAACRVNAAGAAGAIAAGMTAVTAKAPDGSTFQLSRIQAGINGYAHLTNRCNIAANTSTGAVKTTSRTTLTTVGECSDIRLVFTNTITNSAGGEADAAATITVSGAIEYPADTILPVTFNGAATISIPAGNTVISDPVGVDIPAATAFWSRQCVTGSSWPLNVTSVAKSANGGKAGDMIGQKITGATNANPIVITTSGNHNLTTGDLVTITGVTGNTSANVTASACTVLSATTFSISATGNGTYGANTGTLLGGDLTIAGSGTMVTSPGFTTAKGRCERPSFEPMSGSVSVAGSKLNPKRRSTHRTAAWRKAGRPCWNPYLLYAGSASAAVIASIATAGGGVSLSPAPRSMTSTPRSTSRRLSAGISASG